MSELAGMSGTPAEHPPYNLDLAHCDFWVFPKLTQELQGKKIQLQHTGDACHCYNPM